MITTMIREIVIVSNLLTGPLILIGAALSITGAVKYFRAEEGRGRAGVKLGLTGIVILIVTISVWVVIRLHATTLPFVVTG